MGDDDWDPGDAEFPELNDDEIMPSRSRTGVKLAAYAAIAVLVVGGAATYGGFVLGRTTDLSVGSHHRVTLHAQTGCANPAPIVIDKRVWDSEAASPLNWGDKVTGVLTVTMIDADPPHRLHGVFLADQGGQVSFSGGIDKFSSQPCATSS